MALIKDKEAFKRYMGTIELSTSMTTWEPDCLRAEKKWIRPILGDTLYNNLVAAVAGSLTSDEQALIDEIGLALAPLTYYMLYPNMLTRKTDVGVVTPVTQNTQSATKWQYYEELTAFLKKGMDGIEQLYSYLEAGTGKDWYSDWSTGAGFTTRKDLFVNTVAIYTRMVNIADSRWIFKLLESPMRTVELVSIKTQLGASFFAELKTAFKTGNLTTKGEVLVEMLQDAISHLSFGQALLSKMFIEEYMTITLSKEEGNKNSQDEGKYAMYEKQAAEHTHTGQVLLAQAVTYLNENATNSEFATFFNSSLYQAPPESTGEYQSINKQGSASFFFLAK